MADEERKEEPQAKPEAEEKPEEKAEEKKEPEKQPEQQTMRSVFLTGYGGYNKLQVQKHAKPKPASGQVVVRVHACGLNFADIMQRQGQYPSPRKPPFVPGLEFAGTVEELGEDVTDLEVGARVVCITLEGAWCEYACVPARNCVVIPDSLSFEDAAALPVNYLTAYFMLFHCANLGRRKSILIHMAAGGVGIAVTQLCKTVEGITMFGTASAAKHEKIVANGITHAIDYRTTNYAQEVKKVCPEGVDIVLDPLGGNDTKKGYNLLKPLGIIVCYGYAKSIGESKSMFSSAKSWFQGVSYTSMQLFKDTKSVCGFDLKAVPIELIGEALKHLIQLYSEGKIKPVIDQVYALEEVGKAMRKMHERKNVGKIILSPMKEPEPEPTPAPKPEAEAAAPAEPPKETVEAEAKPEEKAEGKEKEEEKKPEEKKEEAKSEEPKEEAKSEEPKEAAKPEEPKEEAKPEEPKEEEKPEEKKEEATS